MRSLLVALSCLCACNALTIKTLKKGDDQNYILPSMADLDGTGKDTTPQGQGPKPTYKPKYTEFSSSTSDSGAEMDDGKTYVPTYKAAVEEMEVPSVTKGFCAGVLQSIEKKEAPYFVNGESSGEMRTDLIKQCGTTICEWGAEYKKLMESDCPKCPASCDGDFDAKEFFNSLLTDEESSSKIVKAILHISGETDSATVELDVKKKDAPVPEESEDEESEGGNDFANLPGGESNTEGDVTRGFCLEVLQGVKDKIAPYYVDGAFTGEARNDLIAQCGDRVCDWSNHVQDTVKANGPCPSDAAGKREFVVSLMSDGKQLGELLVGLGGSTPTVKEA